MYIAPASTEIYTLSLHDALPISTTISGALPRCLASRKRSSSSPSRVLAREKRKDRKSTRLNSSHVRISYAVFCLKKKKKKVIIHSPNNTRLHYPTSTLSLTSKPT